jgi:hypothetical protein
LKRPANAGRFAASSRCGEAILGWVATEVATSGRGGRTFTGCESVSRYCGWHPQRCLPTQKPRSLFGCSNVPTTEKSSARPAERNRVWSLWLSGLARKFVHVSGGLDALALPRKEASVRRGRGLLLVVLSSDAISADGGYRSPRESKRRVPAIGEERVSPDGAGDTSISESRSACHASAGVFGVPANAAKENPRRADATHLGLVDCETAGWGGDRFSSDTKAGRRSLLLQPHSGSAVAQQSHCWAHSAPSESSRAPIRRAVGAGTCAHRGVAVELRHGEHHG